MLCFRRKKCLESDEGEFTRLHEEPVAPKKPAAFVNRANQGTNFTNNIRHVTSQRVLVANGKPLQIIRSKEPNSTQRRQNCYTESQPINYKHLQNSNNVYRPGRNVPVQRSQSAYFPSRPRISNENRARPRSQVYEHHTSYAKLDDIHVDWFVSNDEDKRLGCDGKVESNVFNSVIKDSRPVSTNEKDTLEETLASLDDTLRTYCLDVFESDSTDDEFNIVKKGDKSNDSDKEQTSTDSGMVSPGDSISSTASLNGIIAKNGKTGSKRTSVSFKLPPDHVDKPYTPLRTSKNKSKHSNMITVTAGNYSVPVSMAVDTYSTMPNMKVSNSGHFVASDRNSGAFYQGHVPTICVWDSQNKMWHKKEGVTYRTDKDSAAYMHPFRGSFLNLFYGKYANNDVKTEDKNQRGKAYLAPSILQTIESFESLRDATHYSNSKLGQS